MNWLGDPDFFICTCCNFAKRDCWNPLQQSSQVLSEAVSGPAGGYGLGRQGRRCTAYVAWALRVTDRTGPPNRSRVCVCVGNCIVDLRRASHRTVIKGTARHALCKLRLVGYHFRRAAAFVSRGPGVVTLVRVCQCALVSPPSLDGGQCCETVRMGPVGDGVPLCLRLRRPLLGGQGCCCRDLTVRSAFLVTLS
jgi:hypothetical protein